MEQEIFNNNVLEMILIFGGILEYLSDLALAIDDERLIKQTNFLVELAQPPLDHLFDNGLGLAGSSGLLGQDTPLALKGLRTKLVTGNRLRIRGGDMHREMFS